MPHNVRLMDTGLRSGRENIAHDQAMVDAHAAGKIPDTLKFIQFTPSALIGRHQDLSQELKLDECENRGVQTVRRVSGGGAIYLDQGQIGWGLVCNRKILGSSSLTEITEKICNAVAAGLSTLGIDAQFRPRNDIEVNGQKISGTGGFFDGNTLIFQGTVLVDLDPETMMAVLNVPAHKMEKRDLASAAQRVTSLKSLLGRTPSKGEIQSAMLNGFRDVLDFEFDDGISSDYEEGLAKQYHDEEIGTEEFVADINDPARKADVFVGRNEAGNLKAHVRLEGPKTDRIREVVFTGDIFITPPRILMDFESDLRGTKVEDIDEKTKAFFNKADIGMISLKPVEFTAAIRDAIK
ncbi:MAG: lipoate--protein ligase family protein [Hyphomonadaceae bacterium]|nr:lipoate--protein ligase family protein [Hyphomonadaceae bacterium]